MSDLVEEALKLVENGALSGRRSDSILLRSFGASEDRPVRLRRALCVFA